MTLNIGGRLVGPGQPTWLVAEIGINHGGSVYTALKMVEAAKAAGADALKVQHYHTSCFVSPHATYKGEAQTALFDRYQLCQSDIYAIAQECARLGITFFGTPDCEEGAKWLVETCGAPAIKVGSDDLTNLPLIRAFAGMGVPLILSTGMASAKEIQAAEECLGSERMAQGWARFNAAGRPQYLEDGSWHIPEGLGFEEPKWSWIFLHCSSLYPTPPDKANLRRLRTIGCDPYDGRAEPFCGYSDHTDGIEAACAAVALGACIIEKHFTLDRSLPGPDHAFSADPPQFSEMVRRIREIETLLGSGDIEPSDEEKAMRVVARRSIRSRFDCKEGTLLTRGHLVFQRPGDGLSPARLDDVLGKYLVRAKAAGDIVLTDDVK